MTLKEYEWKTDPDFLETEMRPLLLLKIYHKILYQLMYYIRITYVITNNRKSTCNICYIRKIILM